MTNLEAEFLHRVPADVLQLQRLSVYEEELFKRIEVAPASAGKGREGRRL